MKNLPHVDSLCIKGRGKKLELSELNALFSSFGFVIFVGGFICIL